MKIQIIRAREELRKDWLQLLAEADIVDAKPTTVFHNVTSTMTAEEKWKLIKTGYKRLEKLEAAQAAEDKESRLPEGVEEEEGADEEDDSGPDKITLGSKPSGVLRRGAPRPTCKNGFVLQKTAPQRGLRTPEEPSEAPNPRCAVVQSFPRVDRRPQRFPTS